MPIVWEEVQRRVALGGTVRTPSGDRMGGIAVTAIRGERTKRKSAAGFVERGPTTRTVSKDNGCFGFLDLPQGVYRVTARCDAWDADRFVSLDGSNDVDVTPFDPATTPVPQPPHVEIVLAVRTADGKAQGRIAKKDPAVLPVRLERDCPGTRFIEFG